MGGRVVTATTSRNNVVEEQRIETTSESPNKKKIDEIITHILRFPPGARVTLTNRRLYCALFPVLSVLPYVHLIVWLAGWLDGELIRSANGCIRYRVFRLTIEGSKFHHIPPALRSISLFQHHFGLQPYAIPLFQQTIYSDVDSGGDIIYPNSFLSIRSMFNSRFDSSSNPSRSTAIHPSNHTTDKITHLLVPWAASSSPASRL